MAISEELMSAILAMDSYNRDYHAGYEVDAAKLGSFAALSRRDFISDPDYSAWQTAGFYAAAYRDDVGKTIISYRGTDDVTLDAILDGSTLDFWKGWSIGAGFVGSESQADEAIDFYQRVTGLNYWEAAADTKLVGHSLGGGLAGIVSFLSGTSGHGFDHMPFGIAAWLQNYALESGGVEHELTYSNFDGTFTSGEALQFIRNGSIQTVLGGLLSIVPGLAWLGPTEAILTEYFESFVPKEELPSYGGVRHPVDLSVVE